MDYKGGRNAPMGRHTLRSTCAWVSVPLRGGRTLNAFVDVFNATNEPNFANPINFNTNTANASDLRLAPTFLKLTNLVNGVTRTFQLNLSTASNGCGQVRTGAGGCGRVPVRLRTGAKGAQVRSIASAIHGNRGGVDSNSAPHRFARDCCLLLAALIAGGAAADGQSLSTRSGGCAAAAPAGPAGRPHLPQHRPRRHGRADRRPGSAESNPAVFYVGSATGAVADHQQRHDLGGALRRSRRCGVDRRHRDPAQRRQHDLGRIGREQQPPERLVGQRVYKSTDAGRTWKLMGLGGSRHIARVIVDPVDHDVVYVAASAASGAPARSAAYSRPRTAGPGQRPVRQRGHRRHRACDGSANNKVLYAATYQRRRATWGFNGGPGSAIYKSSDAGRTWTKLTDGIPSGPLGRIGLDVYRANPNILYARIEHEKESGVYRSDNAGQSWRKMSSVNPRPMQLSQIRIDPTNDLPPTFRRPAHISDDGGKTFIENGAMHRSSRDVDQPGEPEPHHRRQRRRRRPELRQGRHVGGHHQHGPGAVLPRDLRHADAVSRLRRPAGQLHVVRAERGAAARASATTTARSGRRRLRGADGPGDGRTVYAESQDGNIVRVDRLTGERKSIRPVAARGEPPLRWNWNTPIVLSAHNPDTIYVAANKVFRSADRGQNWTAISPDLTQNTDRETLSLMGVAPRSSRSPSTTACSPCGNLVQLVESPRQAGVLYAGADDGSVYMTRDDGKNWTNITNKFPGLPKDAHVSRLAASAHDVATVFATFDNHRNDDYGTFVRERRWR